MFAESLAEKLSMEIPETITFYHGSIGALVEYLAINSDAGQIQGTIRQDLSINFGDLDEVVRNCMEEYLIQGPSNSFSKTERTLTLHE